MDYTEEEFEISKYPPGYHFPIALTTDDDITQIYNWRLETFLRARIPLLKKFKRVA